MKDMITADDTEATQDVSLEQLLENGDTSEKEYTVLTGHNMGNNTLLMSVPMHQFWEISEVANERNIGENQAFAGEQIAQRKLDQAHAARLATYILKGLFFSVETKHTGGQSLPVGFVEMQRNLGKQPYLALQPITANIRECNPGGAGLRVTRSGGKLGVWLAPKHVLWVVDGQHRREAMRLVFEFLNTVLKTQKYPKGSLYPGVEKGQEATANELRVWAAVYEAARARCKVTVEVHLGLDAEQERQLFYDLNNLTKKVEASLAFHFDNSNPINLFIKEDLLDTQLVRPIDKDIVNWQEDEGGISRKDIIGINALLFLNKTNITGAKPRSIEEQLEYGRRFWGQVADIPFWGEPGAKHNTVAAQPVVLKALAKLAFTFGWSRTKDEALSERFLEAIPRIDFSHKNPMWRYYLLPAEERDLLCPGLKDYLPQDSESGANRDIGAWDSEKELMRFGAKHNDIYPVLGDAIRWFLNLPSRRKAELSAN